jgi:hypothetical protein
MNDGDITEVNLISRSRDLMRKILESGSFDATTVLNMSLIAGMALLHSDIFR